MRLRYAGRLAGGARFALDDDAQRRSGGSSAVGEGREATGAGREIEARLRVPDTDDVLITADRDSTSMGVADPDGSATLETDAAARITDVGRRPGDPSRICSRVGPERWVAYDAAQRLLMAQ